MPSPPWTLCRLRTSVVYHQRIGAEPVSTASRALDDSCARRAGSRLAISRARAAPSEAKLTTMFRVHPSGATRAPTAAAIRRILASAARSAVSRAAHDFV
jgi:hypothetical protein